MTSGAMRSMLLDEVELVPSAVPFFWASLALALDDLRAGSESV
jgi:hypothetical protein